MLINDFCPRLNSCHLLSLHWEVAPRTISPHTVATGSFPPTRKPVTVIKELKVKKMGGAIVGPRAGFSHPVPHIPTLPFDVHASGGKPG